VKTSHSTKALATTIETFCQEKGIRLKHTLSLELAARLRGHRDLHQDQQTQPLTAQSAEPFDSDSGEHRFFTRNQWARDHETAISYWVWVTQKLQKLEEDKLAPSGFINPVELNPAVRAHTFDDNRTYDITFDAARWFAQATDMMLLGLLSLEDGSLELGGDRESDAVVLYFKSHRLHGGIVDMFAHKTGGFECYVWRADAYAWLRQHRPHLVVADEPPFAVAELASAEAMLNERFSEHKWPAWAVEEQARSVRELHRRVAPLLNPGKPVDPLSALA